MISISIVTAVYNRAATIGQAIESVRRQSYPHVEHVIQDGASTDGTLEVIGRLADTATSLESAPDGGIYEAINRGIERATGDVIGLMHSDDFFAHDEVLARVAGRLEASGADGVYGDLDYVASGATGRVLRHWKSGRYDRAKLSRGWMPPHPTLYLRRSIYERFGGFDTDFRIAADYEAMMRYLVRGGITLDYLPEVMVKMRVGGESNGSLGRILRKSREDLRAIRRHELGGFGTLAMKNLGKIGQFLG